MGGAGAVQKHSLANVLQNQRQTCNFIKERLQHVFPYEIYKIFKNTFFYRTSSLMAASLAVNSVNQMKSFCCQDKNDIPEH